MKRKPARTFIVKHEDGFHINFNRDSGYQAIIDTPYFSANPIGYFDSELEAQIAIDDYRMDQAEQMRRAA